MDRQEIVVRWLALKGGEGIPCLLEEVGDCVGRHACLDDGREGVDAPQKIIGDLREDREYCLPDRQEIVVRWLALEGGEGIPASLKRRVIALGVMPS